MNPPNSTAPDDEGDFSIDTRSTAGAFARVCRERDALRGDKQP